MLKNVLMGCLGISGAIASAMVAVAQGVPSKIVPDSTLGNERSIVQQAGQEELIRGGAQRGQNLFHSFQEFNVGQGRSTYFLNPSSTIQNILTRVTGSNPSEILGTIGIRNDIGVTSQPNLFLINPQGILFGANARLDVGGSFAATTASSIRFGNQGNFSATNPEAPALLTINPSALLFTQLNQSSIVSRSTAPAGVNSIGQTLFGLRVPDGQNLLFVGGEIQIDGSGTGGVRALGGRIELGGLAGIGEVGLDDQFRLSYPTTTSRSNVSLINNAGVSVRGDSGGDISVNANQFNATDGGRLVAGTSGTGNAGSITINANVVNLAGAVSDTERSGLFNAVISPGSGKGGDININTNTLSLSSGARINALTLGQGNAGNITINARESMIAESQSGIFNTVEPGAIANAGEVRINTGSLTLRNSAGITASTFGQGNSGNVVINARDSITFTNQAGILNNIDARAIGQGGNIEITTGSFLLSNLSRVETGNYGRGKAGNISINARDSVTIEGEQTFVTGGVRTGAIVESGNFEPGGNLRISAGSLFLRNAGSLNSATFGRGDAGNIDINVRDRLVLEGGNSAINNGTYGQGNAGNITINAGESVTLSLGTAIGSTVGRSGNSIGIGRAGNLFITTGLLSASDGSQLSAGTIGQGNGGDIVINARDINFSGFAIDEARKIIAPSGIFSRVESGAIGNAGNVVINADSLTLSDGANIVGSTRGQGNSGNVSINVRDRITLQDVANISSDIESTGVGKGGDIQIRAKELVLEEASSISGGTNGNGNAGSIVIDIDSLSMSRPVNLNQTPIVIIGARLRGVPVPTDSSIFSGSISTTTSGDGNAGNITTNVRDRILLDEGNISSDVLGKNGTTLQGRGRGGDISITSGELDLLNNAGISSISSGRGNAGNLLIAVKDSITAQSNSTISTSVLSQFDPEAEGNGGNIQITARSLFLSQSLIGANTLSARGNAGNIIVNVRDRIDMEGRNTSITTASLTKDSRDAGNIELTTRLLSLANGANLSSATVGQGNGGNMVIRASDQILLRNGLFTNITDGEGRAGNSSIETNELSLSQSSYISTAVAPGALGRGGNIEVNANSLLITEGSSINAATQGSGRGGNITIRSHDRLLLSGTSFINTNTTSTGRSGDIRIFDTGSIKIQGVSGIAVGSFGTGRSGDLQIQASTLSLDRGAISAETLGADGGNINLDLKALIMRNNSQISTSVGNPEAGGNGGNMIINSSAILALPRANADITANAFKGNGGNIKISTQGIFGFSINSQQTSETNDITASSQFGISGTVTLNTPDIDPSRGLAELPSVPTDPSNQISQSCSPRVQATSSFIRTGRGGIPASPSEPLDEENAIANWVTLNPQDDRPSKPNSVIPTRSTQPIIEAQSWRRDANGNIELVAEASPSIPHFSQSAPQCLE
ncbi:filamentous hemagglutinin N-terminal domain-containing protein [Phormidesmis sp. 146-35]